MRPYLRALEAEREALRSLAPTAAGARICRDRLAMAEYRPRCSLEHQGESGYSGTHDQKSVLSQVRRLGF